MPLANRLLSALGNRSRPSLSVLELAVRRHGSPELRDPWPHSGLFSSSISSASDSSRPQYSVVKPQGQGGAILRTAVYAIFELGAGQFKVSAGDLVYTERLKGVDVGAELALSKVQAAGSVTETLVGRPYIEGASVTAVVEEQIRDAKVVSFKKRRRKNSRRIKGHRQYLTGLRITGINGILAPESAPAASVVA